jgi:hypothetical protein
MTPHGNEKRHVIIRTLFSAVLVIAYAKSETAQTQSVTSSEQSNTANQSDVEISKQAANPLASLWLLQFQQNNNWIGLPLDRGTEVQSNLLFQPLLSFKLNDNWRLFMRPAIQTFNSTPYVDQSGHTDRVTGLGDTVLAFAVSPGHSLVGNWLLAAGPTFIGPSATESLVGQHKWQFGPTAAVGYVGKHFLNYVFPQQWFSLGGNGQRVSQLSAQYAFIYFFSSGWSLGTNPNMMVNWEAASGSKMTFPIGLQIGKLRKLGPVPVKFDLQGQYYPVRPEVSGPRWNIQLQVTPTIPSPIKRAIF